MNTKHKFAEYVSKHADVPRKSSSADTTLTASIFPWYKVIESMECHKTEIVVRGSSQRSQSMTQRSYSGSSQSSSRSNSTLNGVPVLDIAYCRAGSSFDNFLAAADEAGNVSILNTACTPIQASSGALTVHNNAIFKIEWIPGTQCLITGSGDGNSSVIDIAATRIICTTSGHRGTVRSLSIRPDSTDASRCVFASGGRDGAVCVYDTRLSGLQSAELACEPHVIAPIHAIQGAHLRSARSNTPTPKGSRSRKSVPKSSVTSVQFLNDNLFATCGLPDGRLKLWDMRKLPNASGKAKDLRPYIVRSIDCTGNDDRGDASFLHLSVTPDGSKMYATSDDNSIYEYEVAVQQHNDESGTEWRRVFRGMSVKSCYARSSLSADLKFLASGSSDCCVYVWPLDDVANGTTQPFKLKGHECEATAVAWHASQCYQLASCSDDASILIWRDTEANSTTAAANNERLDENVLPGMRDVQGGKWKYDNSEDLDCGLPQPNAHASTVKEDVTIVEDI